MEFGVPPFRQGLVLHLFMFSLAVHMSFLALRKDKSGKLSTTPKASGLSFSLLRRFVFWPTGCTTVGVKQWWKSASSDFLLWPLLSTEVSLFFESSVTILGVACSSVDGEIISFSKPESQMQKCNFGRSISPARLLVKCCFTLTLL